MLSIASITSRPVDNPLLTQYQLKQEALFRFNTQRIKRFYPDHGPYAREKYVKHLEFFKAGIDCRERLMLAANRCISPWTVISMGFSKGRFSDILGEKKFCVQSWDGDSQCNNQASGLFLKGIEPMFRVYLDNGEFFDCTYKHRVLTSCGWIAFGQLIQSASGLRYFEKSKDCRANYDRDNGLGDESPLWDKDTFGTQPLPLSDAHGQTQSPYWLGGEVGHISQYSHVLKFSSHPPILDDPYLIEAQCEQFANPESWLSFQWTSDARQAMRQSVDELTLGLKGFPSWFRQSSTEPACHVGHVSHGAREMFEQHNEITPKSWQSQEILFSGQVNFQFEVSNLRRWIFFPFDIPYDLVGNQKIQSIVNIGLQPIIDFTVDNSNCYFAGGVIHHNTGKTEGVGGYELTLHLTGEYPDWWEGRRFDRPIRAWAGGDTGGTVRDIIQAKLMGPIGYFGTGLIPQKNILGKPRLKTGVPDAIESVHIRHKTGGSSRLQFKSYDQGRRSWQGTEQDVIWYDEEPPFDVYTEGLMRTMTTGGLVLCTFTPLQGLSNTVLHFLPDGQLIEQSSSKYVVMATWDDAPHLSQEQRDELFNSIPPYQRDARTKGIPQLGSGAIYPVPESDIVVPPFEIPSYFGRSYNMDVGWNCTAANWQAYDRDNDIIYIYSVYKRGQAEPAIHAAAIRARGEWIPGVVDPASRGRTQTDGTQLLVMYRDLGLELYPADNSRESGIYNVFQRLSTGRLKVFGTCPEWLTEYRLYRRDEKGNIVKENDHLMDATRYGVMSGLSIARTEPRDEVFDMRSQRQGRSAIAGY